MIIRSVVLNNIRSYSGKWEIDFATDVQRNVTLVEGVNGTGKTSLFVAINWALFGLGYRYTGYMIHEPLVRKEAGSTVSGSASVRFAHNGEEFYLSRGITAQLTPDGKIVEKESGLEMYRTDRGGNAKPERFPQNWIDSILPPPIRTFFFFDGDKISEFARPGRERDALITKAVNDVLRLDLLDRAERHLQMIVRDIEKEEGKLSPRVNELVTSREDVRAQITTAEERAKRIQAEIDAATTNLGKLSAKLQSLAEVAEKARRREGWESELSQILARIAACKAEIMEATRQAVAYPVREQLQAALSLLDERRRKREIPANYKDQFLRDLLKMQKCICERPLERGTREWQHIENLLKAAIPGGVQEQALELASAVRRIIAGIDESVSRLRSKQEELERLSVSRDQLEAAIKSLGEKIRSDLAEGFRGLENDRDRTQDELTNLRIDSSRNNDELKRLRYEDEHLDREIKRESAKEESLRDLREQHAFASDAARAFSSIKDRLITTLKDDMGVEATAIFKAFTWKTNYFDHIQVGDDYLIQLIGVDGTDLRGGVSMGETQLLSLAFMLSMIAVSEYEAPLVIDTPLARLSAEVRTNLLKALPSLTRQLVLLCTDTEMNKEARRALGDAVGREYNLSFNAGVSAITEAVSA